MEINRREWMIGTSALAAAGTAFSRQSPDKGWFARPRGMAARMRFRTSHIHLVVSSAPEPAPEPEKKERAKAIRERKKLLAEKAKGKER